MELLFKREQTAGRLRRVTFKLWSKIELDEEEQALLARYRLDNAVMIAGTQEDLLKRAGAVGFLAFFLILSPLVVWLGVPIGLPLSLLVGVAVGYWYFNEKRETIMVKDLLHGRYFSCDSVVELIRKEDWMEGAAGYFRQLLESAKHWGGTERRTVQPLPPEDARRAVR